MTFREAAKQAQLTVLDGLQDRLPPVISRKDVDRYLGGLVSRKTLSNADAMGQGPKVRVVLGEGPRQEVAYETGSLLEWLESRKVRILAKP